MGDQEVYEEIRALCIQIARHDHRFMVVKNEDDDNTNIDKEADEFLKFEEQRIGRDFKLYNLMASMSSKGGAIADFAEVLMFIKQKAPDAFGAVKETVLNWDRFYEPDMKDGWRDIWA